MREWKGQRGPTFIIKALLPFTFRCLQPPSADRTVSRFKQDTITEADLDAKSGGRGYKGKRMVSTPRLCQNMPRESQSSPSRPILSLRYRQIHIANPGCGMIFNKKGGNGDAGPPIVSTPRTRKSSRRGGLVLSAWKECRNVIRRNGCVACSARELPFPGGVLVGAGRP